MTNKEKQNMDNMAKIWLEMLFVKEEKQEK